MLTSALVFKIFTGIKCVTTFHLLKSVHLGKSPEGKNLWFQQFLLQSYLRIFSPHIFIAISSDIEQWLIRDMCIAKSKIRKVFNGIDSRYFHVSNYEERRQARAKFNLSDQDFTIALVGRTQWEKGHKLVVDAVNQITEKGETLDWLSWLLIRGGDIIIQEYDVEWCPPKSRTHMLIMVKGVGRRWRVPTYFQGTVQNNVITRVLDTMQSTYANSIENIMKREITAIS
jgi:glycosyltransferase involved in cell wall biosynthesis